MMAMCRQYCALEGNAKATTKKKSTDHENINRESLNIFQYCRSASKYGKHSKRQKADLLPFYYNILY